MRVRCGRRPQHDRNGLGGGLPDESGCERHTGFAFVKNKHGPCALAADKVTFPMASLASGVDILGPFMDGNAILNCQLVAPYVSDYKKGLTAPGRGPGRNMSLKTAAKAQRDVARRANASPAARLVVAAFENLVQFVRADAVRPFL